MWYAIFILATVATNTIPRWIPHYDGDLFCIWQAISFVLMGIAMLFMKNTKTDRIIRDWCVGLAINNAIDEICRVAEKTNPFEVYFAIIVTLCTVYRLKKCQSKHKATT